MLFTTRRMATFAAPAVCLAMGLLTLSPGAATAADESTWESLRPDLFAERSIAEGTDVIAVEAPYRAHDAGIVPIRIQAKLPQTEDRYIKAITLIIDENPAPVAATFTFARSVGNAGLETRVRVNEYSFVRAIAEMNDGSLHMAKAFVKASGGCGAPAMKDQDEAIASMGKMKLRQLGRDAEAVAGQTPVDWAQLMIRHPNYSGFQRNQITLHYIPAHFVHKIEVDLDGETVMTVDGAISMSEDPTIRFHLPAGRSGDVTVRAVDTEEQVFSKSWPFKGSAGTGL